MMFTSWGRKWTILAIFCLAASTGYGQDISDADAQSDDTQTAADGPLLDASLPDARDLGFDSALDTVFPMTPDMVRRFRGAFDDNEKAAFERPYPKTLDDAALVTLEPGDEPIELRVAPGIASVIGIYDATGRPWPVRQYVLGDNKNFEVAQLGETASAIVVSPLARVGWTNLVIALAGEESPLVAKIIIDSHKAHFKQTVQIMKAGPNAVDFALADTNRLPSPGDRQMIATLMGADISGNATPVPVSGVDALAWAVGEQLYVRSQHALLSPPYWSSLAGPGGVRVYRLEMHPALLFSVDGRVMQAILDLP